MTLQLPNYPITKLSDNTPANATTFNAPHWDTDENLNYLKEELEKLSPIPLDVGIELKRTSTTAIAIRVEHMALFDSNVTGINLSNWTLNPDVTGTSSFPILNGLDQRAKQASTHYDVWLIYNGTTKASLLCESERVGTCDSTTSNKLEDSNEIFNVTPNLVHVGDKVYNTTDNTQTTVTAIDDANTLSVADDIFVSGETYTIALTPDMPTGYTYRRRVGWFLTDGSSNIKDFIQKGNECLLTQQTMSTNTSDSLVTVDISAFIPTHVRKIMFHINATTSGGVRLFYDVMGDSNGTMFLLRHDQQHEGVYPSQSGMYCSGRGIIEFPQTIYHIRQASSGTFGLTLDGVEIEFAI